jgi:hypothetical protein
MDPDEPRDDTEDSERLMNLVGDLHMAFNRAMKAGADVADVLTCSGQALGEFLADQQVRNPTTLVMTAVASTAQRAHDHRGRVQ